MIENVSQSIKEIQTQNSQLSSAADQQDSIGNEINKNIEQINSVSQTTNESTAQLLVLAEEISSSVQAINRQLNKFTH